MQSTTSATYVGWHGHDNIGDDSIFDAVSSQLPGVVLNDLPHYGREAFLSTFRPKFRHAPLIVGGGTVVGRHTWRQVIERGLRINKAGPYFALGIGVEDPAFQGKASCSADGELSRWLPVLRRFSSISVRGPRSAALLADMGFSVRLSGDPALILPLPTTTPEDDLIGLNMGFGDDLWGHNPHHVAAHLSTAVRHLSKKGYRFLGVLMNPDDEPWTRQALHGIPGADVRAPSTAHEAVQLLGTCGIVIASRLHAGILASLSATPVIALEYQPKCRDFAESIGNTDLLIRTDELTAHAVIELVESATQQNRAIRARTRERVDELRRRLLADYAQVRSTLGVLRDIDAGPGCSPDPAAQDGMHRRT